METSEDHPLNGWNKNEKLALYQGIKTYGSYDIEGIQEHIPDKSREAIEKAVIYFKDKALKQEEACMTTRERTIGYGKERKRAKKSPSVPLNSWAKLLTETFPFNDLRTETATALRLIADFEDIPQALCTEKIDFRKIYHTLANALEGKPLCEDKYVATVIDKCIIETALTSKAFMRCNSLKNALKDIRLTDTDINPFNKPTENNELSVLRHILMLRNYNPMNIPEQHLKFSVMS